MGNGKKDQVRRAALGVASAALCFSLSSVRPELGAAGPTCGDIATLRIPGITVTTADDVPAGAPLPGLRSTSATAICRVAALATPTTDSRIAIELWVPTADAWNGKLLGTANGGFSGAIPYAAMAAGVGRGYATVGTDTGHTGDQMEFGDGHPEKIADWAYRSVHVMTDFAKLALRDYRGRFPEHAYFEGCSTGGQQALSEAQRFPRDYDGIVAGDPGHNRVRLILGFLWSWNAVHGEDGSLILPPAKLPVLTRAAIAACDANDGLKDGLIGDARACRFDPSALLCPGADDGSCLTAAQVDAVKKVYEGARNTRTGEQIFQGWARGSEQGWGSYIVNPREPVRIDFFRYFAFHDPHWNARTFDWDRDVAFVDDQVPFLSATSRDLSAFRQNRGKLIMYTGWADPVVPPQDTVDYYEGVVKAMGGLQATQQFFRFFPVPAMGHCMGGPGPNSFDALGALERWSERGVAPEQLLASHSANGIVDQTRPVCAFPKVARYRGTGDIRAAANFSCVPN
ncbi:MAG TPA: tannase/feruloyl esterase family alpha/beta hydrolase [Vicinamibacterales bacterium]|nr:tannase/feruloyl esterase family alpha/beta hydrolase [Vicinamibacterales bacterium]